MAVFFLIVIFIEEGKKRYIKRKAYRPNFHKGSRPRIPSQTIGNAKVQINSESAIQELKNVANKYKNINDPRGFLTDLRNALGIPDSKGASKYGVITIPKKRWNRIGCFTQNNESSSKCRHVY